MLIASAESVLCAGNESKARFTSVSAEAKLEAKVKALIVVEFDQNQKTLSFVKDDGQEETDEDKQTFFFTVKTAAVGYGLKFEPTGNLKKDTQGSLALYNDEGDKLPIMATLKDGKGEVVGFKINEIVPFKTTSYTGKWSLKFSSVLTNETAQGTYSGGVKITVVPTE